MEEDQIKRILEAALLASDGPLTVAQLGKLFGDGELDEENASKQIREALKQLQEAAEERGVELKRVASGYRYQVRQELSQWVSRLWDEKPPRYTRALLETLSLVAYKQPVTRGDIEQVRGVSVSQSIMRTLVERDWIRVVGQKEVPGRPSLYGTTKAFLDYFNLKSLDELPPLAEIRALIEPALVEEEVIEPRQADDLILAQADADEVGSEPETLEPGNPQQADDNQVDMSSADIEVSEQATGADSDLETSEGIAAHVELPSMSDDQTSADTSEDGESSNVTADVVQLHGSSPAN